MEPLIASPGVAFFASLLLYSGFLGILYLQNLFAKGKFRSEWSVIVNVELLCFLSLYYFILCGNRLVDRFQTIDTLIALSFYFGGLAFFHYTFNHQSSRLRKAEAIKQLKLVAPFAIPFIILLIIMDLTSIVPESWNIPTFIVGSGVAFILLLMFLPKMICEAWGCVKLQDVETRKRLENLCLKANFKYADILEWTVMNQTPTAAIMGIMPNYRYVLFSRHLLHALPPEAVDAILAHEIGHSKRKHLVIYPTIILGMMLSASIVGDLIGNLFVDENITSGLPVLMFLIYAIVLGLYFRFVFGFFSRLFERQADLYVMELGMPLESMILALDQVGITAGNTHFVPSWHHYSIAQRIEFLKKVIAKPELASKHHRFVNKALVVYGILLILAIVYQIY